MKVNNIEYLVGKKAKLNSALEPFNPKIINLPINEFNTEFITL